MGTLCFNAIKKSSCPYAGAVCTNPVPLSIVTWSPSKNCLSLSPSLKLLYFKPLRC